MSQNNHDRLLRRYTSRNVSWSSQKQFWTIEKIQKGLERYKQEHARYPTGPEMDVCDYLPSSRQIQRSFGGLKGLREKLGLDIIDFRKGALRSQAVAQIGQRGHEWENHIERMLAKKFGEVYVHREQPLNQIFYADFVVYAQGITIAIDVFYPRSFHSFIRNLQIKLKHYSRLSISYPLFLVYLNDQIDSEEIKRHLIRKAFPVPGFIKIISVKEFVQYVESLKPLEPPNNLIEILDLK